MICFRVEPGRKPIPVLTRVIWRGSDAPGKRTLRGRRWKSLPSMPRMRWKNLLSTRLRRIRLIRLIRRLVIRKSFNKLLINLPNTTGRRLMRLEPGWLQGRRSLASRKSMTRTMVTLSRCLSSPTCLRLSSCGLLRRN